MWMRCGWLGNDLWMVVSDQIDQTDSDCQWPSQKGDTGAASIAVYGLAEPILNVSAHSLFDRNLVPAVTI